MREYSLFSKAESHLEKVLAERKLDKNSVMNKMKPMLATKMENNQSPQTDLMFKYDWRYKNITNIVS